MNNIIFYAAGALGLLVVFTLARIYGEIVKIRKLLQGEQ